MMSHPAVTLVLQIHLVVIHSLLASAAPVVVPCSPEQASVLLRLKRSFSTTSKSMGALRSWKAGTNCCRWEGIRCDAGDGRVTSLDLANHGFLISGGIDPALFDLTSLEYLNLAHNDFNGSQLPSSGFERLVKLTYLNLSSCCFDGQVPTAIRHLINLVSLDLSTGFEILDLIDDGIATEGDCDSHDSIGLVEPNLEDFIANLSNLRELHLGSVDLSDNGAGWCDVLAKFTPELHVLSLPFCQLSGPICTSFSNLQSLEIIDLSHNHLPGPIPDFWTRFSNLSVLQLQYNNLEGWISPTIFKHMKLSTINLYKNYQISGSLPNFSSTSSLENLVVGETSFSGTIPTSVSNLKSLKRLGLSASGFSGELPSSIGRLKSLNALELSGMGITGFIPSWIANLTALTTLVFSHCGLSGSIPSFIGNLRGLKTLALCDCHFSGKIPPHVANLTQLQVLLLYSNNLVGTIELVSFKKFQHLDTLDMSNNNLVVVDGEDNSSLPHLPKFGLLSLSGCSMTKFPNFLRHQDKIQWLDLSHNQIHGSIPQWAWETWDYFFVLDLSNNKFTSIGYDPFLPLNVKLAFAVSNNMFEGPIPTPRGFTTILDYSNNAFSSLPSNLNSHLRGVTLLIASKNNFSGNIPSSFCGATSIKLLDLSYNNFSGSIPPCMVDNVNGMQYLNLRGNQLDGEFPNNIKEGCTFEALDFSLNKIEGQLPRSLVACKNLEVLDVGNNQISDSFPCWMSRLHKLQVLVLKSNKLFGHVPYSVAGEQSNTCAFPKVTIIDLSSNNFSGSLPQDQWFKQLKSMSFRDANTSLIMDHKLPLTRQTYKYTTQITYKGHATTFAKILTSLVFIDVSDNAFSGGIPEAIGELVLLHGLNLSHNLLTGPIPSQVGRLSQLEALDLSSNELLGVIPQEVASLHFLTVLNLSNNKLEGKIPESPHFLTFSNDSFIGNDALCGLPLTKECVNTTTHINEVPEHYAVDIMMFLFAGLGFGVGFAVAIVVTCGLYFKKRV